MVLVTGFQKSDRKEQDGWFQRAMVDPDNVDACRYRLIALEPSWSGSIDELASFATSCRRYGDFETGIQQLWLTGNGRVRELRGKTADATNNWPETEAWFRGLVKDHPDNRWLRSQFAKSAFAARQYAVAHEQFGVLKGNPSAVVYPQRVEFERESRLAGMFRPGNVDEDSFPNDFGYAHLDLTGWRPGIRKRREAWYNKTVTAAFEKANPAMAKGRKEGLAAITAVATYYGIPYQNNPRVDAAMVALTAAINAGCDDLLIRYLYFSLGARTGLLVDADLPAQVLSATSAFASSTYPAPLRLDASLVMALTELRADEQPGRAWDNFLSYFKAAAGDSDTTAMTAVIQVATHLAELGDLPGLTRATSHGKLLACLAEAKADPYIRLVLSGSDSISAAWQARGGGSGLDLTAEQLSGFRARLREAERFFTAAWRLRPERPEASRLMITVCMGMGHTRGVMEQWYDQAMKANPDDLDATRRRTLYLEPKWHTCVVPVYGETFRQLKKQAFDAGFGDLAHDVLQNIFFVYQNRRPTDAVCWDEELELFGKEWLRAEPADRYAKTLFAREAVIAKKTLIADKLFRELGDKPWPDVFESREEYRKIAERIRKEAKE